MVFTKKVGDQFESLSDAFIAFVENFGKQRNFSPMHLWKQVWESSQNAPN